ncbi:hypothetical protein CJU90_2018 [Yarrowia sp. C11]|nr:hypothetical protein CKK34_6046 [Yarrowia sp. E02]KAG5371950.1 hypothetical protein CJU90_2018 [Yarrowia sp. C11]
MTLPGREGDRERAAALEEQIKILAEAASNALDRVGELEQEVAKQQKEIEGYKTEIGEKQQCIEKLSTEVGELMTKSVTTRDVSEPAVQKPKPCLTCKAREIKASRAVTMSTQTDPVKNTETGSDSPTTASRDLSRDPHIEHVAQVVVAEELARSRGQSTASTATSADSSFSSLHSSPSRDSSFTDISDFSDDDIAGIPTLYMSAEQIKAVDRSNLEQHVNQLQRMVKKNQSRDDDLFRMQKLEAALVAVSRARAVLRKA